VTGGRAADRASLRHRSSLVFVLGVVWGNRQLRRVELAFATFSAGEWAWWIAMLVYAYAQGGVTESGILATVLLIPAAAFPPAMTAVGERYAPGSVLLAGYAGQALSCAAVAIALFADARPLIVYVLLLGPSIVFTITRPTQSSFAPAVARTPEELTATNVASGWIESVSMLVAPALAGVVLAVWSETAVFALAAAGCAFGAALVLPLRNVAPPVPRSEHGDRDGARLGGALSTVRRDPEAAMLVSLLGAQGVAVGALGVLSVEYAQHVLHRGGDWVGYLNAAFGAGGVIAVVMTARLVGKARLIGPLVLALAVWSLSFIGLAALPGAVGALALIAVGGSARATFDVAGRTLLQRVARPDLLWRHFGLLEGLMMGACAVGSLLAPLLVWLGGVSLAWICVGAILPLVAVTAGRRLLDIDRHATVPVVEVALLRSMPLFAPLPPPTLESLARALEPLRLPAGVDVIHQGDEGHQFYVIADGEVEIVRDGRRVAARLRRGDGFGEIALIHDVLRTATVTTRRETQLYSLDREPFLLAVTGHSAVKRAAHDLAEARLEALRAVDEAAPVDR
jgi:Cyclic nucleotide-binding domain/Major Facilitator Superfamily